MDARTAEGTRAARGTRLRGGARYRGAHEVISRRPRRPALAVRRPRFRNESGALEGLTIAAGSVASARTGRRSDDAVSGRTWRLALGDVRGIRARHPNFREAVARRARRGVLPPSADSPASRVPVRTRDATIYSRSFRRCLQRLSI